jgi:zinc transport system substrate-binding protein
MRMSLIIGFLVAGLVALPACGGEGAGPRPGRVDVVAALYPLAFLAERIGGDAADVTDLTPAGVEPHDLELTANQIATLAEADLVLYVGEGFQPAVEDAIANAVEGRALDALESGSLPASSLGRAEGGKEHAGEGEIDPHLWLSPPRYADLAQEVGDEMAAVDSDNAREYEDNASELIAELEALDDEFRSGLADCQRNEIIVSHAAFGYVAEEYGLEQQALAGLDPGVEPSPARLAEVAGFAEERDATTVFYEELVSPAVARTLADEVGLRTEVLSPLETAPERGDYVSAMEANLDRLKRALGCR